MKEEIDSNNNSGGLYNTSLTPMDRSSKMKINKETEAFMLCRRVIGDSDLFARDYQLITGNAGLH